MSKRTLDNCSLAKKHGYPERSGGRCNGLSSSTEELIEVCEKCKLNTYYDENDGEMKDEYMRSGY